MNISLFKILITIYISKTYGYLITKSGIFGIGGKNRRTTRCCGDYPHAAGSGITSDKKSLEVPELKQLIYCSRPFGFDRATLAGILVEARRNNLRDDITGALVCRHDLYIQLIEGPEAEIDALYARIADDNRHCEVRLILSNDVSERMFPEWQMLDDEMPTITWSPEEVADGAIERTTPAALYAMFEQVASRARARPAPAT